MSLESGYIDFLNGIREEISKEIARQLSEIPASGAPAQGALSASPESGGASIPSQTPKPVAGGEINDFLKELLYAADSCK
jgi:serine/threonine protein kinase HipA of HipAB toxin-antitoxin module